MIDIHCHILPGIDDGPQHLPETLKMAKKAVSQGITSIIATPHHKNGQYDNDKEKILERVEELNDTLEQAGVPLTIFPGQETRLYGELLEDLERGQVLTMNDQKQHLFIELPSGHVPRYTEQIIYDLLMKGITPIIVHPERNKELLSTPDMLYQFVKKGALTQVTASSLTGGFGSKIKKFSQELIEANLTHFIASDAHNVGNRPFKMKEAYDLVEKKYGEDMLYYFIENAELLLDGKTVYKEIPQRITAKKFLGIF